MVDSDIAISNKQLHHFHKSRFGGDYTLLILRILFYLGPTLYTEYITIPLTSWRGRTYYFTQISLSLVTFISILSVIISLMKILSIQIPRKMLRTYQILFQITFTSQTMVFVVYWTSIHHTIDVLLVGKPEGYLFYIWIVHIVPFLACCVELLIARPVVVLSEIKYILGFQIVYTLNNFIQTKLFDWLPYPFMMWEDYTSLIACFIIAGVTALFYFMASLATNSINGVKEKED